MDDSRIIKPPALRIGATLGIVCPADSLAVLEKNVPERGYRRLEERGFRIVESSNCRFVQGHTAGSIEERVRAIHTLFSNDNIDAVLAFWGGFQSHQLLERLDFDLLRANPKPFIGYSDITALQHAIWTKAKLVTFYGPGVISFSKPHCFDYTWDSLAKVLMNSTLPIVLRESATFSDNKWWLDAERQMRVEPSPGWRCYRSGAAEGWLAAGNLTTMLLLHSTPWWPSLRGAVLFIEEDEDETPAKIDRTLTRLRHLGVFDEICGLVIGRFSRSCGFSKEDSLDQILDEVLHGYRFPVLVDVDFGHTDPMLTLPIGIACRINAEARTIELLESAVAS